LQVLVFAVIGGSFLINARDLAARPKQRFQLYQPKRASWLTGLAPSCSRSRPGDLGLLVAGG